MYRSLDDSDADTAAGNPSAGRRRVLIIHNPNAGRRRRRHRLATVIAELERAGARVELKPTARAGDAIRYAHAALASAALGEGPDVVVAAGGDGTVNEVVNGLAGGTLPLALIPLGTANVLAAEIGLDERSDALVRAILHGLAVPIHLGEANGRRFTLMAGIGLDADVVASVSQRLKRRTGKFAYAVATLQRWLAYRRHRFLIEIDGVPHRAAAAVVANGHYYAGRFVCADKARLTEPLLHVCLFEKPGRWQAVYYMLGLFGGFLPRLKSYRIVTGREIAILEDDARPVQGDGDVIARLPVRIRVADETLPLVMPAAG
ncbi:MAG: diacylglycerol kinase family lipid kinase [Thalassobaculum sp.]|uniref:diacylglycerol/lipid kinase family protein n=1 Tax=Thalassobaculum sp. TaxID=2022740 RepID=UPI0032EEF0A9